MVDKVRALLEWCKYQCKGYAHVTISNFTSSWKSGLAFCAIIHRFRPDLINYDCLQANDTYTNCKLAFNTAYQLGIPALLDAEDMVSMSVPDRLSIITYVSQYYNIFGKNYPRVNGQKTVTRAAEKELANTVPIKIAREQTCLPAISKKQATLEDKCFKCGNKVYLLQRQWTEGRLFHRHCVREMSQQATLERIQQVNSIKSASHVPDTSVQERDKAREIIMKNMNRLIPRVDPPKQHLGKENLPSTSQKQPLKLPISSSTNYTTALSNCSNTKVSVLSNESRTIPNSQSVLKFPTSSTASETHNVPHKSSSKLEFPSWSKPKDSPSRNNQSYTSQPPTLPSLNEEPQKQTSKSTTHLTPRRDYSFFKPLNSTVNSPKAHELPSSKNLPSSHTSSINIINNETKNTISKTSIDKTPKNISREYAEKNKDNVDKTPINGLTSQKSQSELIDLSLLYSKVNKNMSKVVEEASEENTKTEWQLEVERRMKMRKGVYEDPEFKGRKSQNEVYFEIKRSSEQHQHRSQVVSSYSATSFLDYDSDTYDCIPADNACETLDFQKPKEIKDFESFVPRAIQVSTATNTSKSTWNGYTNPIYVSNISSNTKLKRNSIVVPIKVQDTDGNLTEVVRKPDHKHQTSQKNISTKSSSTPASNSFTSFQPLSTPTTSKISSPFSLFSTMSSIMKKPPLHTTTQPSIKSNTQTDSKSHFYMSPESTSSSSQEKIYLPMIMSTTKNLPHSTSQPLPKPVSIISSSLPDRTTTTTSSLPPSPHTIPSPTNMSFRETLFTSSNMKDAAKKGVFRNNSSLAINGVVSSPQAEQQEPFYKRDYIDLAKYKPQAYNVSKRKVSTEVHIAYREIENQIERLIEEMLMVEERGRELEESIRQHDEESDKEEGIDLLMYQWLELVRRRNDLIRRETDFKNKRKQQEYDELHENLEYQLRLLISIPESEKSPGDMHFEEFLIKELQKIVDLRNQIVDSIEHDREKYLKEDEQLHYWTNDTTPEKSTEKKKGKKFKRLFKRKSSSDKKEIKEKEKETSKKEKKKNKKKSLK